MTMTDPVISAVPAPEWPVARSYQGRARNRISLPLGGIGTGTVGFGGRGQFRDWELENRPAKGLLSALTFLACRVAGDGRGTGPTARILEGAIFDEEADGWQGSPAPLAGMPRFRDCEFQACYPFGRVVLSDPDFPLAVTVEAVSPLVPGDAEASGLPLALIRVGLTSRASRPVSASVMLSAEAMTGHGHRARGEASDPRAVVMGDGDGALTGYLLSDAALPDGHEDAGSIAAAALGPGAWTGPAWGIGKWNQGLFAMWRGFTETGRPGAGLYQLGGHGPTVAAAIAGTVGADREIAPGATVTVTFALAWHYPSRHAWRGEEIGPRGYSGPETVGNHYTTGADSAWDVLTRHVPAAGRLRAATADFVSAFWSSDLPSVVKEAALFNLSTLRSQTFFRTADGRPFAWEGCLDDAGSCFGSCTHVWNYDLATHYLFGGLARQMRELEYLHATDESGAMSFRISLPLGRATAYPVTAADGQFGCVVKLLRDWRLSGDDEWLRRLWPACRRSIEFAWITGGWDADRDGLAEGAQHNTMDVEYYGPNPVVQGWYLAALAAGAQLADAAGDAEFAARCQNVLASGQAATEARLFTGRYYKQEVIPPGDFGTIAPRLRSDSMGAQRPDQPEFQIGDGCIIDQLVGDSYARLAGLGPVLDPGHARTALESIHQLNYQADFGRLTNYMRTYAVHGERGHIVESYPDGLPEHPMPYWPEAWPGLEYVYAIGLAQHGQAELALDVVSAVRERFSGVRRNPFDEVECGHHYARSLASWGLVVALTGFGYDARAGRMSFAAAGQPATWFWSDGTAWGIVRQDPGEGVPGGGEAPAVRIEVLHGAVQLSEVTVGCHRYVGGGLLRAGSGRDLQPAG